MPRLCILTQYFPPEMGAPQARLSELGECLVDRGWDVEVLTALPNYPAGRVFDGYDPRRPVRERYGRLDVVRVPLWPSQRGFARRLACYFSFAAAAAALGPRHCVRPDLLFVESPPLFIGYAAKVLARRWKVPYVFNVSDLWPESAIRMGVVKPGLATAMAERLEISMYRRAAGVTGQSSEIVEAVGKKAPAVPTALVTNGVDGARFGRHLADREARALVGDEPGVVCMYAGLFGLAQGLDQILDLALRLPAEANVRFVLVGDGPVRAQLEERIRRERISRVKLVPAQPRARIPALLACADVAVISLGVDIPGAVPSKIYEAMASSLPILLIASGEPAARVRDAGAGVVAAPGDAAALEACTRQLLGDDTLRARLGAAGRRAAETTYDRRAIAARLDTFLRGRLGPGARGVA